MELVRPVKKQRTAAFVADSDSPAVLSEETTESVQDTPVAASTAVEDSPKRKPKVLPVPRLIPPGPLLDELDLWGCTALLVDKPQTWTSFDVCGKLKGVLRVKKIGHAGTLDPMATGLLIICTGRATKSIDSFQAMHKEYSGTLRLGEATNSYDADGDITDTLPWQHVTLEDLQQEAHKSFQGDLQQIPPMFSALRVKGKRLYEIAREGKVVERAARSVHVSQFDLTPDQTDPQQVHFYISCSKGTYIRSLAHDLGQAVGSAAHLVALRREAIGTYSVKDAWTVEQLQAAVTDLKHNKAQMRAADMDAQHDKATDAASAASSDKAQGSVPMETAITPDAAHCQTDIGSAQQQASDSCTQEAPHGSL
ncbi:hypothetical protein ABBQ38_006722 [Trebouxia sp. C0009 RCD-2024]